MALHHSEFHNNNYDYILIKYGTHQEFSLHLQKLLNESYEPIWETFRITPVQEAYLIILRRKKY